jgi:asparagine N-glycosylation enzyme membrane subunit Stt3
VLGSAAGAIVFGILRYWTGFIFFAVATLLATVQLVRIGIRRRPTGGAGRRW